jgi:hypothetical protein
LRDADFVLAFRFVDAFLKYATGEVTLSDNPSIYFLSRPLMEDWASLTSFFIREIGTQEL